jgi:hypothetical protein
MSDLDIGCDPDELREIARAIREFRFVLNEQGASLRQQLHSLEWNDVRQQKFKDAVDPYFEIAKNMEDRIRDMEQYAEQYAAKVDAYLRGA